VPELAAAAIDLADGLALTRFASASKDVRLESMKALVVAEIRLRFPTVVRQQASKSVSKPRPTHEPEEDLNAVGQGRR